MKIKKGCTLWARQTLESEIFYYKPDKWFKIWFFIVNSVNHKDTKLFKRGEGLITYEDISRKTKATRTQIEKCLKWMKKDGMIDERRTTRGNIKIILKYGVFQEMKTYQKTGETNDETITRRTRDDKKAVPIDKNDKNEKNVADKKSATKTPPEEKFNQKEYIDGMKKKKQAHIRFIGWYFEKRKSNFPTKESIQIETKRWLKDASFIVKYPQIKVSKAYELVRQKYPDEWNMSTIRKVIPEA